MLWRSNLPELPLAVPKVPSPPRRRFRPTFSVRSLAIFVTLVCAYLAAREATSRNGLREKYPHRHIYYYKNPYSDDFPAMDAYSPMPFVVTFTQGVDNHARRHTNVVYRCLLG